MRALLLASAGLLVLAACDQSATDEAASGGADVAAADAPAEAPAAPPPGPGEQMADALDEIRANNPRVGPDRTAEFVPDPNVAEQRPPNALSLGGLEPAFPEQTRAPIPAETHAWRIEDVASGFNHPWGLEFLPDGSVLISERIGQFRIVSPDGTVGEPITGVPEVWAEGQGGLFDVALAPDFESSRRIYFAYSPIVEEDRTATTLATAILPDGASAIEDVEVLWQQHPAWATPGHFGGRIAIDGEHIFLTLGERMLPEPRAIAQQTDNTLGKLVRLNLDGSIPDDNPFAADGGDPAIWTMGHRSNQAADFDPVSGNLFTVEHGPRGGDELNLIEPGNNYGWPVVCYCIDYSGLPMSDYETSRPEFTEPVYYWDPVIAPGGMSFYTGDLFPNWTNDLFVAGEGSMRLSRLVFNADRTRVVGEEWLPIGARTREVKTGPDGALWVITEEDDSRLFRIVPE